MKRICLFAGYNYNNIISNYVIDYLKELSNYTDIYYLADGALENKELLKIAPFVINSWVINHGKYDFGSYSELAKNYVGWNIIEQYDELLLVNDSCFCVNSFQPVFNKMDHLDIDVWGLLFTDESNIYKTFTVSDYFQDNCMSKFPNTFCLGTYFFAIRASFFKTVLFQGFLNNVSKLKNRTEVCTKYEYGFTKLLIENNISISSYFDTIYRYSTTYATEAFMLIKNGFPLLKVRLFTDNIGGAKEPLVSASVTEKFCDFSYLQYIKDIKNERNIPKPKIKKSKDKEFKLIVDYFIPRILMDIFKFIKASRRNYKNHIKAIRCFFKYLTPPILHDIVKSPKILINCMRDNRLKFCLRSRPSHKGYYPCHIKNYDKIQKNRVSSQLSKQSDNIVIFFNIMRDGISGGMLSIDRFVAQSQKMMNDVTIIQSGLPLDNAIIDNLYFDYSLAPISFNYIIKSTLPKKLLLNIPEFFLPDFIHGLTKDEYFWLWSIPDLRINILNQSDELIPDQYYIEEARLLCSDKLTMTAAHQRYCTLEKEKEYNCPIYLLTPFLPDFYYLPIESKEKIIILSPDTNSYKTEIISLFKKQLADYKLIIIEKMKLNDYKKLISKALFAITFGEGYDGYFVEPALSGSISFAVYNDIYFPKDMKQLETLYNSWDTLKRNIVRDIRKYESNTEYYQYISSTIRNEIRKYTNDSLSIKNLDEYHQRFLKDN